MDSQKLREKITDEYSEKILNWAVKKTGSRAEGECLAQEVFLQVFLAIEKYGKIGKPENLVWKIARFTWCNYMRTLVRRNTCVLAENTPDGTDFAQEFAESETMKSDLSRMRRRIADLSRLQREAIILHYLDGLSVRETSKKLNITETAAAWNLFDARQKIKKELETMKDEKSHVYRPGKLHVNASPGLLKMSASGDAPINPDTEKINDSLVRQNIILLCRGEGKSIDELAELTGVPKPYLENDLDWLTKRGFLSLHKKHYQTSFIIMNQKYFEYRKVMYLKHKTGICDAITGYLWDNEQAIRKTVFYGNDFPAEKLMWAVITLFISYVSWNNGLMLRLKSNDNREIQADGGKYYIMAFDGSDGYKIDLSGGHKPGWNNFYGICSDICGTEVIGTYYWLGAYNFFAAEARPEITTCDEKTRKVLHKLYCNTSGKKFSPNDLTADEKEKLAEAVKNCLILKDGNSWKPNFVIFTKKQIENLRNTIFAPLLKLIEPEFEELAKQFGKIHKADFPKAKQSNIDHHTYFDLWMFGVFTLMFAVDEKKLYLPKTPAEGAPLTLVLVK